MNVQNVRRGGARKYVIGIAITTVILVIISTVSTLMSQRGNMFLIKIRK